MEQPRESLESRVYVLTEQLSQANQLCTDLNVKLVDYEILLSRAAAEIRMLRRRCGLKAFEDVEFSEEEIKKDQEEKPSAVKPAKLTSVPSSKKRTTPKKS